MELLVDLLRTCIVNIGVGILDPNDVGAGKPS